ncbi:hypothetical protein ABBQ32_005927 [Trebouxia sp. C0010 RCD-2024]
MGQRSRNSTRGGKSEGKASTSKAQTGPEGDDCNRENTQLERFWHSLSPQERTDMLSITVDDFNAKLLDVTDAGTVAAIQEGMQRLLKSGSWKRYGWDNQAQLDSRSFRLQIRERTNSHLRTLLPEAEAGHKSSERRQQLHKRLSTLVKDIQENKIDCPVPDEAEAAKLPSWKTPIMTSVANLILRALLKEHKYLYKATIAPIIQHIKRVLPQKDSLSSILDANGQMALEHRDLDLLPSSQLQRVNNWLEGTVHQFRRAASKSAGEAASWEVPPLQVSASKAKLTVNPEWLQQLQEATAMSSKSGKGQPRVSTKAQKGSSKRPGQQAPLQGGRDAALQWLCGVPSKKAPSAGLPWSAAEAFEQLGVALQETYQWVGRVDRAKELITVIETHRSMKSRIPYTHARRQACSKDVIPAELATISQQLRQEIHLTDAKKHNTSYQCSVAQQRIIHLMDEGRQITANVQNVAVRLDALRELLPSSLGDVPLRTQLAELGILSEVQVLYKTMEIHDAEMKKNEEEREKAGNEEDKTQQEHMRLLQWFNTVTSAYEALATAANEVVDHHQFLVDSAQADMIADGFSEDCVKQLRGAWVPMDQGLQARADLLRLMESFRDNLWPQLMTDKDDANLYRALQAELEHLEGMVAEGCAALPLLEAKLMSAACHDPGPLIMDQVVLPLLQQRLTAKAEALHVSGSTSQSSISGLTPVELLLAEEERKAANKVSGKKGASVQKKQDKSSGPNIGSSNTSSQEAAATSLKPARMHLTLPAAAADTAASAETAAAAFSSQERFGEQAYAHMAAEVLANPPCHLPGFAKPNVDCHAIDQEYATQYEQLLAEEAARVAAESSPSASPAHLPADSAGQVAGLISTTAPACAPVSLAEGTKEKASSLLIGELDQADAASQASHTPVCVYPDDFMGRRCYYHLIH